MSSNQVVQKGESDIGSTTSEVFRKTTETVASATASIPKAIDGSLQAGAHASSKTSDTSGDQPLSKAEADRLYEERIEDEYAKREGGA